jgi:serine/threonine protein kinase/CRP-like cAMP-binding protein
VPPPNRLPRHDANRLGQSYKRLGTVLGEGAYGIVEMGRQNRSGELVAIKSVTCHDPHERDALERELVALEWVLAHGGHPGLLHLMDIYRRGSGTMMIVSELCPGGELFDKLVNEGPMSEREAAHLTKSLADALHFLHDTCGWAHGDMKPENVMLNNELSDSPVTLVDLGSAHPKEADPSCGQVGTTAYWSPESFSNAKYVGGTESDMFAMGILLYIMIYGAHPFDVDGTATDEEMGQRIMDCEWRFLPAGANDGLGGTIPKLSEGVRRVISSLLEQRPQERMTAHQLCDDPWFAKAMTDGDDEAAAAAAAAVSTPFLMSATTSTTTPKTDDEGAGSQRDLSSGKAQTTKSITLRRHSKKIIMLKELVERAPDDGGRIRLASDQGRLSNSTRQKNGDSDSCGSGSWLGSDAGKVLSSLDRVMYPEDTVIIEEGDTSDSSWYLLLDGLVQVELTDPASGDTLVAAQLREGSFFGEGSAAEPGKPRAATIRSLTKVDLMKLDARDLQRIVELEKLSEEETARLYHKDDGVFLSTISQRRALVRLRTLLQHSSDAGDDAVQLSPGEILFNEGDVANSVYLVVGGRLSIVSTGVMEVDDAPITLSAGDLLGETAVMTGQPRNATVSAGSEGATLTRISREQFVDILGSNNAIARNLRELKKDSFMKTERRRHSRNAADLNSSA